ncbi:type II secretion system protein GspD [Gemmatimonadota bacterium]
MEPKHTTAGAAPRKRTGGSTTGILAAISFIALLAAITPARAQQRGQQAGPVTLNFQDLELGYVLTALAQAGGINLIYHDLPAKPVTLRTAQPIPRSDIPEVIRALAAANGLAVYEDVGFMRIVGGGEEAEPDTRQLYIYRLRHARAATLATTLQALFGGSTTITGGSTQRAQTLSRQLQQLQQGAQVTQTAPQVFTIGGPAAAGLQGNVLIVPEDVTNSLLIRAAPADWEIVQLALENLDLRPLQVVIEVLIAEVRHSDDFDLGVALHGERETSGGWGVLDLPTRAAERDDTFLVSVADFGSVDIQASLAALATTGEVKILSRPVVLAQNNQSARIIVGTQQPFIQSSQLLPGDVTGVPYQTVQYREVGTVLNILPTINEDGYVNLTVSQEVSNATTETQFGAPIISTREAETQLLARNGQTIVLGGLVGDETEEIRGGIPILKDIPLLGFLFRTTTQRRGTNELFLFLTPYIVASDEDAELFRQRVESQHESIPPDLQQQTITPPIPPVIPPTIPPVGPPVSSPQVRQTPRTATWQPKGGGVIP